MAPSTAEDEERKFNRTENIRQIPQTDPEFKRLYLLTYALTVNSLALRRHQACHGEPPLPLAA